MTLPAHDPAGHRTTANAAILDAAWALFAQRGPDGASLRDVAVAAECTHGLIRLHYGSKDGLVDAVATRLSDRVDRTVIKAVTDSQDPLLELLRSSRAHRPSLQLLVRSALGDLPPRGFPACLHVEALLEPVWAAIPLAAKGRGDRRSKLSAYAAASLCLGFVTFEGFLVAATRLKPLGPHDLDAAVAAAAHELLALAARPEPLLPPRDLSAARNLDASADSRATTSREALLASAIELFAERGPASVPVRDIARHAGVNQGLIYRQFGSKDALLAEVIERGGSGLFPAALAADGFDFDTMSWLLHHSSPAPRLIARTLVDGVEISRVRQRFPIVRQLLASYDHLPGGAGPGDLSDPRIAVLALAGMALGSVIWGDHLQGELGLDPSDGIDAAVADLARFLVAAPTRAKEAAPNL